MKRTAFQLLMILTMLLPVGTSVAAEQEVELVSIVTPASRTNQAWDQQGVDNLVATGEKMGFDVAVAENAGYEDITPILQDLADDGSDLIICHASGYQTVCPEFAAQSGIPVVVIENPSAVTEGLVSDIETQAQEAAYLAGVLAGLETKTGTIAIVVTGEPPTWNYMTVGFAEGLHSVRPDATLLYSIVGEAAYDDAPNAKRVTEAVLAGGADIVFGMGDGASFGMIQAIREYNAEQPDKQQARFIDVIGDKSGSEAKDFLLTSVLFDYKGVYKDLVSDLKAEEFGSVVTMNLENNGVRLLEPPIRVDPEHLQILSETRNKIVDGEIEVSAIGDADGTHERLEELFPGDN
ncbi:MAG TPA: BMP family protein [Thermomicrobiales bacterium]|nr:BMP family protein [Thermomicrobiales bacterium]